MITKWNLILCAAVMLSGCKVEQKTEIQYLSGKDKDTTVKWDFFCTKGRQSGQWKTIKVPANWELEGFGEYNYGHDRPKSDEQGKYRTSFNIPAGWNDKKVILVFEGVMTDTEVFVNGKSAGPIHQGGFYEFQYDITMLLDKDADNLLEVTVSKVSANKTVELAERKADYWVFGGIYRPVYLKAVPAEYIDWTAIDAKADGSFLIDVYTAGVSSCDTITAQIMDHQGNPAGQPFQTTIKMGQDKSTLTTKIAGQKNWTAETPHLYTVKLELTRSGDVIHSVTQRFGFRTFQVRDNGLFLNGQRIMLKGVNRHSFWPDSGRCLSDEISYDDVRLMKAMNMNAVRMSHYPPEKNFLKACDELGLYVLDELTAWQKPAYDTTVGKKLVKELVRRDVNYASILFWCNGNEGGFNPDLDGQFGKYDPQDRPVLHPWEKFSGIDTKHYINYGACLKRLKGPLLFMPTEFLHGLYDGGHGAGLDDYWKAMNSSPYGAGGFLWVLADEGLVRTDRDGEIDTDGNHAPDGIVGPYREKEGSFYTIREVWSPVQIATKELPNNFDGKISVENNYDFTSLKEIQFAWQLVDFASPLSEQTGFTVASEGKMTGPAVLPHSTGTINLQLPADWRTHDALYLTAIDWQGQTVCKWNWPLRSPKQIADLIPAGSEGQTLSVASEPGAIVVTAGKYRFAFDASNGQLNKVSTSQKKFALNNGPRLIPATQQASTATISHSKNGDNYVIKAKNSQGLDQLQWTIYPDGRLLLDYQYSLEGKYDYFGVAFDLPEETIQGMRWLGAGPHRVWKNRLKGTWLNVWQRDYNKGLTGQVWDYPEFPGYYDDFYWVDLTTATGNIKVFNKTDGLYLRPGQLRNASAPKKTKIELPEGGLSFMHAINPIGTKFKMPKDLGPSGKKNIARGTYRASLMFKFD